MKITVIGDIHGRTNWKNIIEKEFDSDYIIFLGDYFDPYERIPAEDLIDNFKNILDWKERFPDKIILLIGNHDLHYITSNVMAKSRYSPEVDKLVNGLLRELVLSEKMQICFQHGNYVFSHAGFTKTWTEETVGYFRDYRLINKHFIEAILNDSVEFYDFRERYDWRTDPYGDNNFQGPLWVRPNSLALDSIAGVIQVVGHTRIKYEKFYNGQILLCDALEHGIYYIIEYDEKTFYKTTLKQI